jgi:hypothetical protein
MPIDTRFQRALSFAKQGKLEEAQNLLLTIDTPEAEKLLERVNKALAARGASKPQIAPVTSEVVAEGIKRAEKTKEKAKAKQTANGCLGFIAFICICGFILTIVPKTTPSTSDSQIGSADVENFETILETGIITITDIDLESVEIAEAPNGSRTIIIGYTSHANNETELLGEYGTIFGAVGTLVQQYDMSIRELGIVVGDERGNAVETVAVDMDDIIAFLNGIISIETFANRMTRTDF